MGNLRNGFSGSASASTSIATLTNADGDTNGRKLICGQRYNVTAARSDFLSSAVAKVSTSSGGSCGRLVFQLLGEAPLTSSMRLGSVCRMQSQSTSVMTGISMLDEPQESTRMGSLIYVCSRFEGHVYEQLNEGQYASAQQRGFQHLVKHESRVLHSLGVPVNWIEIASFRSCEEATKADHGHP